MIFGQDTKILCADASFKNVQDLFPGDKIMNENGESVQIMYINRGRDTIRTFTFKNKLNYKIGASQLLNMKSDEGIIAIKCSEITNNHSFIKTKMNIPDKILKLSPYSYGFNLQNEIHENYKLGSIKQRQELLAAIIDRHGTNNSLHIMLTNVQPILDLIFLCKSLNINVCVRDEGLELYGSEVKNIPCKLVQNNIKDIRDVREFTMQDGEEFFYDIVTSEPCDFILEDFVLA